MIVINKKRISIIVICLVLGIFVYSYEGTKINLDQEIQETTATPVSGKVIVLDAGHGVPDGGVSLLHQVKNKSNYSFIN